MKSVLWIVLALVITGAGYAFFKKEKTIEGPVYTFERIERGNLESIISSTGTLNPVNTVQVGTQVSGIVSKIYVDFNDHVREGQLVAKIDDTFLKASLNDAQANLDRVTAQMELARIDFERAENLFKEKIATEQDYLTKKYNYDQARANLKSSQFAFERAKTNLAYTNIYSPINGIVLSRNVSVGQTVAASMSAPTLFVIAEDMSKMEITADVDESDIGQIKPGMKSRFTVQAYEDGFEGKVRQVRLQPTTSENVVNYKVVIDVDNPDGKLLPGMTATVDFLVETAENVLTVSNTALRFKPSEEFLQQIEDARLATMPDSIRELTIKIRDIVAAGGEIPDELRQQMRSMRGAGQRPQGAIPGGFGGPGGFGAQGSRGSFSEAFASLYYFDSLGNPGSIRVIKGISDGQKTQIRGRNIPDSLLVIKSYANPLTTSNTSSQPAPNLFNTDNRPRFPGGI